MTFIILFEQDGLTHSREIKADNHGDAMHRFFELTGNANIISCELAPGQERPAMTPEEHNKFPKGRW